MTTYWLYLHFPSLQLDSLYQDQSDVPIAIVHGKKSQVVQCNTAAFNAGIREGMGLGASAALCSELQVHPYDDGIEKQRLTSIAQWLYVVTSDICLVEPNGLLLRVSNMLTLYQSLASYWQVMLQHIKSLSINFHYALALSPYAAKILAKSHYDEVIDDPILIDKALSLQQLHHSELTIKHQEQLRRVGVKTLGDLVCLPLADIAKRFDIELVNYIGRLTGKLKHIVSFYHPPEQFEQYLELFFDISHIEHLQKPLGRLYRLLEQFLRLRDKRTHQLSLTLHLRDAEKLQFSIHSSESEYQHSRWLTLSQLTLESVQLTAPVTGITLVVESMVDNGEEIHDLLAGKQSALSSQQLVSRLQAKLGVEHVHGIALVDDHRPEKATHYNKPLSHQGTHNIASPTMRPSFLLPSPETLIEKVQIFHGPERIVSGWWDQDYVVRDYFIAQGDSGRWLWIFRTPNKQWFVQGLFS